MNRAVLDMSPSGLGASVFAAAVRLAGALTAPVAHRGFWHATALLGRFIDRACVCTVSISSQSVFAFRCGDPYWARLLSPTYVYEPELLDLRERLRGTDYVFLDCGANFGFWSLLFSEVGHARAVIAVEAMPATFARLEHNRHRNGDRFATLNRAVHTRAGETVRIGQQGDNHAGAGIADAGVPVETISIDTLRAQFNPDDMVTVVKLDVEGVEIPAFEGATAFMHSRFIAIYEDHGNDPSSRVTAFVIANLDLVVLFRDEHGRHVEIRSADHASSFKKKRSVGYNFFGVSRDMLGLFAPV
jgi:FkbM family methyltransferase